MSVSLSKGGNVSLSKSAPNLADIDICLGWDAKDKNASGAEFDLDAMLFACDPSGKCASEKDFVYFNNLKHPSGAITHMGDELTGSAVGDDEVIQVKLKALPNTVDKTVVAVNIHEAILRKQTFGQVRNAFVRIVDKSNGTEIVRYDLSEDFATDTAVVFGEIYRKDSEWKFRAVGQGFAGGIDALVKSMGLGVA